MRARFHPEASGDIVCTTEHYTRIRADLGWQFANHIDELVREIEKTPTAFRVFRVPQIRRHFRRPFPFAVVYVVRPDHIWIIAVMHFRRRPDHWLRRLASP